MNSDTKPTTPAAQEAEPTAAVSAMPIWLIVLTFLLLYWGALNFDKHGGWFNPKVYGPYASFAEVEAWQPKSGEGQMVARGKVVYEMTCALCHNADGMGKPNLAPLLSGSEWVLAEGPNRMIRIPLNGLTGPIQVKGQQYNFPSGMAAMGAALSDEDLAAVLTYIRQSWGNRAPAVTLDQVKKVRAEVGNRTQPWTIQELNAIPEK